MARKRKAQRRKQPAPPPEPRAWYRFRRTLSVPGVGTFRDGQCARLTDAQHRANCNSLVALTPETPVRLQVNPGQRVQHNEREHVAGDLLQCAFAEAVPLVNSGAAAIVEAARQDGPGAWSFTRTRLRGGGLVARRESEILKDAAHAAGL